MEDWKERALKAEKQLEEYQYLALAAKYAVDAWPTITLRTLRSFCTHMDNIKDALKKVL